MTDRKRLRLSRMAEEDDEELEDSDMDRATKLVESFFKQSFKAKDELKEQFKGMGKSTECIDWSRVKGKGANTLYTSKLFDCLEWWQRVGRKNHFEIFCVVLSIAAVPAANAHQERTYSSCTWLDDSLRQRMTDDHFEEQVLLSVNKDFLED